MHQSSYDIVKNFVTEYVKEFDTVVDIGSCDVNGTFRDLFPTQHYLGIDIMGGPNVNVVLDNAYHWNCIKSKSVDIVICGSVIEHTKFPWEIFREIYRVLKLNGHFCIVAPASWDEHKYPVDCYRFYPDGMRALCEQTYLTVITCETTKAYNDVPGHFADTYCIGERIYS